MLRDQQKAVRSDLMLTLISFTKLCVKVSAFNILLVTVAFTYSLYVCTEVHTTDSHL